ncbi:unnamed protein product [Sphenostylis stenocarpa]|uniref:Uncharacterized protein n=1 Tax=Sphenostylis stenocarpa TaxID=92480 RepID=A0AA86SA25_9FABA|nr:unnamed protein product [Sphenostylis stenocarpa]
MAALRKQKREHIFKGLTLEGTFGKLKVSFSPLSLKSAPANPLKSLATNELNLSFLSS